MERCTLRRVCAENVGLMRKWKTAINGPRWDPERQHLLTSVEGRLPDFASLTDGIQSAAITDLACEDCVGLPADLGLGSPDSFFKVDTNGYMLRKFASGYITASYQYVQ